MTSNATFAITTNELIERNCVNVINLFLSAFGIFGNITVVILICKNPQLRKNCKYLQAALAVGDSVLCSGQLTNASVNLIVANLDPKIIRWRCLLLSTHGAIAIMYSMTMTVFIAADRFVAIISPVRYRKLPKLRTCLYAVGAALSASVAFAMAAYTDVNLYDYPLGCIGSSSRSAAMSGMINSFNAASGVVVLIVYPITLIALTYKTKKLIPSNANNSNNHYFMKQVEVTASITCVVMASLILYVIPNLLLIIFKSLNVQPLITSKAPAYIGLGSTIHSGINCLFYIWKDKKMREALMNLFSFSKATVFVLSRASGTVPH